MSYMSIHSQAERLRYLILDTQRAKERLQGMHFLQPAEECLELIYDDLDNAIRKATAAMDILHAMMAEHEGDDEEDETTDRYVVVGRE